ncbi:Counting factor associated protein D [Hypsibius exemplaris]|uniref:Counting factor associated protein D n=1 Tax=Hypsibius exemplaris TaxID=2072580 RepID=A0A1W0WTU4_HYPEX|nr:Counting factor associated protein D [Hypsibius exemplaris]
MAVSLVLALLLGVAVVNGVKVPDFGSHYTASGVILLPYAEIKEPFNAYFDLDNNRSRIDYYGGMVMTFQRGDIAPSGVSYKVAPETTESVLNAQTCFQVNGTQDAEILPQSILPDLTEFTFKGEVSCKWGTCELYLLTTEVGDKINRYKFLLSRGKDGAAVPRQYEMKGYDSLIGSHYDKYIVKYIEFSTDKPDASAFDIPEGLTCAGFPGPGAGMIHRVEANPMAEYIHREDNHVQAAFTDFKSAHAKDYPDTKEHSRRQNHFRHNYRFVKSHNRAGKKYKLKINHLADKSDDELSYLRGRLSSKGKTNNGLFFDKKQYRKKDVPDSIDWRLNGAVTPVKDQAICGSCWSFGTVGSIEGALFVKTGKLTKLSEQNLVDCSWGYGNNACDGGEEWRAYEWVMKHGGIATDDSYGAYLGADGYCHYNSSNTIIGAKIASYVNVTSGDEMALKMAIAVQGPVAVGIDAAHKSLSFYSHGVYYEPDCKNGVDDLDHAVLAVGYGSLNGEPYWLLKNSWSTYWGDDGYVLMSRKDNNCGVTTDATFVNIA